MAEATREETKIIQNIKLYIDYNNLSLTKIAREAGMTYIRLWSIMNRNQGLKLTDYISLCRAFQEPLERFIPGTVPNPSEEEYNKDTAGSDASDRDRSS